MTALSKMTREQLNEEARRVGVAAPDAIPTVKELRETIAAFIENGVDPHGGAEGKNGGADEQTGAAHGMVGNASFDAAQGDSGDDGDEDDDSGGDDEHDSGDGDGAVEPDDGRFAAEGAGPSDRCAYFEQHPDHLGGEVFVRGGERARVAMTGGVRRALQRGALVRAERAG